MTAISKVSREMVEGKFVVDATTSNGQVTLVFSDGTLLTFSASNVSGGSKTVKDISISGGNAVLLYTDGTTQTLSGLVGSGGVSTNEDGAYVIFKVLKVSPYTVTVVKSHNVTGVTRTGNGRYTIGIQPGTFADGDFFVSAMCSEDHSINYLSSTATTLNITSSDPADNDIFSDPTNVDSNGTMSNSVPGTIFVGMSTKAFAGPMGPTGPAGADAGAVTSTGITAVSNFQSATLSAVASVSKNVTLGAPYTGRLVAICLYVWRNANIIWDITDVSIGGKPMTRVAKGLGSNNRAIGGIYVLPEETLNNTTLTVTTNSTLIMWGYHIFTLSGASATPGYVFQGSGDVAESGPWAFPVNAVQNNRTLAFLWNYFPDANAQGQFVFSNMKNSQTSISRWTTNENISSTVGYANMPVGNPSLAYAWGQSATYDGVFKLVASFPPN